VSVLEIYDMYDHEENDGGWTKDSEYKCRLCDWVISETEHISSRDDLENKLKDHLQLHFMEYNFRV
jgi:hypothetical protein